jgi:hypothetical protein
MNDVVPWYDSQVAAAVVATIAALGGAWLGSWLSARGAAKQARLDRLHQNRTDALRRVTAGLSEWRLLASTPDADKTLDDAYRTLFEALGAAEYVSLLVHEDRRAKIRKSREEVLGRVDGATPADLFTPVVQHLLDAAEALREEILAE